MHICIKRLVHEDNFFFTNKCKYVGITSVENMLPLFPWSQYFWHIITANIICSNVCQASCFTVLARFTLYTLCTYFIWQLIKSYLFNSILDLPNPKLDPAYLAKTLDSNHITFTFYLDIVFLFLTHTHFIHFCNLFCKDGVIFFL